MIEGKIDEVRFFFPKRQRMKKEFIMLKTRDNNERHCKKGKGQCKEWYKKGFIKTYWNGNTKLGYQNSEGHSLSVKRMSVNPKGIDKHSDIIKNPQKQDVEEQK